MLNKLFSLIETVIKEEKSKTNTKINYINISDDFPILKKIKQCKSTYIKSCNLDVNILKSRSFKCDLYLSSECDRSKVFLDVKESKDELEINVSYDGDNANGYLSIESDALESLDITDDNGDIIMSYLNIHDVKTRNSNGDTIVDKVVLNEADITSKNGDVILKLANKSRLSLKASNGDVITNGVESSEDSSSNVNCVVKNGDIIVEKSY